MRLWTLMRYGLLAMVLLFGFGSDLSAWMVRIPLTDLVKEADHIIIGDVIGMESFWSEDGRLILTRVTLSADEDVKGVSSDRHYDVTYVGGVVGEIGLKQSDTPTFRKGERVLIFLTAERKGTWSVTGRYQGKFTVKNQRILERDEELDLFVKQIQSISRQR